MKIKYSKSTKPLYVLIEEDSDTGENRVCGIFSTPELAKFAHDEFDVQFNNHYPTRYTIEEYYIDSQIERILDWKKCEA